MKYSIEQRYLSAPSKRRSGVKLPKVMFIVAHDTGNPGSTAAQNVRYYQNSRNERSASAHLFVDNKQIIECIPALTGIPEKAWHVLYAVTPDNNIYGVDANDGAISVELCFGKTLNNQEAYKRYIWVMAYICYKFKLNPLKHIVGHEMLDPTRKVDPSTGLKYVNKTFPVFLQDVMNEYKECTKQNKRPTNELTVLATALNVRNAPSMNGKILRQLKKGQVVKVVGKKGGWYKIGKNEYCSANEEYVKFRSS